MGYTHYWTMSRDFTDSEWEALQTIARKVCTQAQDFEDIALSEEFDINRTPVINDNEIRFNGYADEGHETFLITRVREFPEWRKDEPHFQFCKTARNPYDAVVVAILQGCAVYCDAFSWSSDGWRSEHDDGIKLYNKATGANWDYSNVEMADNDPARGAS